MAQRAWKTAWVTGASSGIGRELALMLAREGCRVAISARSAEKLAEVAALDDRITAFPVDVTNRAAMAETAAAIKAQFGPIDLVVLNAGLWHPQLAKQYDAAKAINSMAVNYAGVAHALEPLIADMVARRQGHIAMVASVAGYRGLPQASAYAPSKSAVITLAEVLRLELAEHAIHVQVINPGFVETPMTAVNQFDMPYIMSAEAAAGHILAGLKTQRFEIAFPWQLVATLKLLRLLPYSLYFRVAKRFLPK
jgi:short-subunit dehydrogenase